MQKSRMAESGNKYDKLPAMAPEGITMKWYLMRAVS